MSPAVLDLPLVARSLVAVASSPASSDWPLYRRLVESAPRSERPIASPEELTSALAGRPRPNESASRIVASLVSFTDDHLEKVPETLFPVQASAAYHRLLERHEGAPLGLVEQLAAAGAGARTPFEALLSCHAVTRHLARGRDARALGFSLSTVKRCEVGRAIAAFPSELSRGGDPLGDTYHYWANVIAGVSAAHFGGVRGAVIAELFRAGPVLMTTIRGGLFGRTLFYGDHAAIDRLGLAHGLALGAAPSA